MSAPDRKNIRLDHRPPEFFLSFPTAEVAVISALLDGDRSPQKASEVLSAVEDMCCSLHMRGDQEYPVAAADRLIRAFFNVKGHFILEGTLSGYLAKNGADSAIIMTENRYIYWNARQGCCEKIYGSRRPPAAVYFLHKKGLRESFSCLRPMPADCVESILIIELAL